MKYQLVIQFPEEKYDNLDWIADIEDSLDERLVDAEVDGHDIGSGEINIFVHTNVPIDSFEIIKNFLKESSNLDKAKIAYRDFNSEHYVCLWPKKLKKFQVI